MRHKLIIDGNAVYEIDDDCQRCKEEQQARKQQVYGGRARRSKSTASERAKEKHP